MSSSAHNAVGEPSELDIRPMVCVRRALYNMDHRAMRRYTVEMEAILKNSSLHRSLSPVGEMEENNVTNVLRGRLVRVGLFPRK